MPIARFEMPDGRIGRFEVPDGTTPEEARTMIEQFVGAGGKPQTEKQTIAQKSASELNDVTAADLIAGSVPGRFAVGAASPILGAIERLGLRSPEDRKTLEAMQQRGGAALDAQGAGTVADIAGNVLSPAWLAAAKYIPTAATLPGRMAQGAGLGAAGGFLTPTDDPWTAAGVGGVLGGLAPAALAGIGKVGSTAANFIPKLRKESFYRAAAGDKADEIIDLLRRNEQLVQGSAPTAGQAASPASRAEFSAIQAAAARALPSKYAARTDEQSAAQLAKLRSIGQTPADLDAAVSARSAAADPLYTAARSGAPIDVKPIVADVNKMLADNPGNTELVTELTKVKKSLLTKGGVRDDPQQISSVIDGLKSAMAKEDNKFIAGKLDSVKTSIEKAIPGYEQAQREFAQKSIPVNQMQVGQYLEGVATPTGYKPGAGVPLREKQFLEAVRKSTAVAGDDAARRAADLFAKRTTGSPRFKELTDVLDPRQMQAVADVVADFSRNRQYIEQAVRGAANVPQFKETAKLPNLLMREAMVMNAIIGKAEGKINEKLAAEIAVEMLNPPGVGDSIHRAMRRAEMNKARAVTLDAWMKAAIPGLTQYGVQASE
jgi:hypothetical protein